MITESDDDDDVCQLEEFSEERSLVTESDGYAELLSILLFFVVA